VKVYFHFVGIKHDRLFSKAAFNQLGDIV